MKMTKAPGSDLQFESIRGDEKVCHETLVDLFGRYVFWIRNWAIRRTRRLVESNDARERLRAISRRPYEAIGEERNERREAAMLLAEANLDSFIQLLLSVLAHRGYEYELGGKHVVRFRLTMEIVDQVSEEIVHEEAINRDGEKHFSDYWGRWLNRPWTNEI